VLLDIQNIAKTYTGRTLFTDASFFIDQKEKAALVGDNGAGKTTIFKIIMGLVEPDSGQVIKAKDAKIGYMAQDREADGDETIYSYAFSVRPEIPALWEKMEASRKRMKTLSGEELQSEVAAYSAAEEAYGREGGYSYKSEVTGVLKGLGFPESEFGRGINELSGGQKTRLALGRLLLMKPDLLLLDEPTNHLDIESTAWLENHLKTYPGAVLVISHDRFFMNRFVGKVICLEDGATRTYKGDYDAFSEKRRQLRRDMLFAYEKQQAEMRHQEEVIKKLKQFNREKSIKRAESREKALEKLKTSAVAAPSAEKEGMRLRFTPAVESGEDVLIASGLSKAFGENRLFDDVSFTVTRGERICVIGGNGLGKSTLLKMITGKTSIDSGKLRRGVNVEIAYYDQEIQLLTNEKTVYDEIADSYPKLGTTKVRSHLAAFGFTGDAVLKQVGMLSGGERARVSLAKLMLSDANFIILDEPTNHLDITSREILESALSSYEGTLLCVTHDRYFANSVATRILELKDGRFTSYPGNYDYYLAKKAENASPAVDSPAPQKQPTAAAADWKARKEEQARRRKCLSDLKKAEDRIAGLEEENAALQEQLQDPQIACDHVRLAEISEKSAALEKELEELYASWEALSEEAAGFSED